MRRLDAYLEPVLPLAGWIGAGTPESVEFGQSIVRILVATASGAVLLGLSMLVTIPPECILLFLTFLIFAILNAYWVHQDPQPLRVRRGITLIFDNLATSAFVGYGGVFALYAAIHFWTTVGYGLRFGTRYLLLASLLAVIGMGYNVGYMPYWQANLSQGITIILALLAMTASTALVFRRIHVVSTELDKQHAEVARLALDRLGRLKGFFSPQVAELIVSGGGEDLMKTHRREVVVVFTDLRGFTAFTDSSEPEEVMGVLSDYHRVMGPLIIGAEGTLVHFAGDGLMVLFNDPIKLEDPLGNAVKMAIRMQDVFAPLRANWKKRSYALDLGIGIAQRYATLGRIGFEGRWEYTCIGSVANLASRLCGEAKGGQILINQKTLGRIEDLVQAEPLGEIALKGISQPVPTFRITALKS